MNKYFHILFLLLIHSLTLKASIFSVPALVTSSDQGNESPKERTLVACDYFRFNFSHPMEEDIEELCNIDNLDDRLRNSFGKDVFNKALSECMHANEGERESDDEPFGFLKTLYINLYNKTQIEDESLMDILNSMHDSWHEQINKLSKAQKKILLNSE